MKTLPSRPFPSSVCRSCGPSRGFTLVELLVSILIVAILAVLVMAITGKLRERGRQATAINALRQIGSAQAAYSAENSGAINVMRDGAEAGTGHEGGPNAWVSNTFWGRLQPHLFGGIETNNQKLLATNIKASLATLFDTTDLKTMKGTPFEGIKAYGDLSGISVPIAFNLSLRPAWRAAPKKVASFGNPANTLYCTYGRYFIDKSHAKTYTPLPVGGSGSRGIYFLPNKKAIVCFLDGHIETVGTPMPDRFFP